MRNVKRFLSISMATALVLGSTMTVSAAGVKDLFNAKHYSESYEDLKDAFGDNEKALYKHYTTYGLKEGRIASQWFDVVKYREKYDDLDAAFGDDWSKYVEHYLTFGLKEGRDGCGELDAVTYADRYEDLFKAFGYDLVNLMNHYETYGKIEGRDATSEDNIVVTTWYDEDHYDDDNTGSGDVTPDDNTGSGDVTPDDNTGSGDVTPDDNTGSGDDNTGSGDDNTGSGDDNTDDVVDISGINVFGVNTLYHSIDDIHNYINNSGANVSNNTDVVGLSINSPYSAGTVSSDDLNEALAMLNQIRYIAGLDANVTLNAEYTDYAQTGSMVNAANGKLSHTPTQPEGMDKDLYDKGYTGTSSSNIAWASYKTTLSKSVLLWMDDSDASNIDRLGHRRWILNPSMQQTGFGYAYAESVGTYSSMYAFDNAFGSTDKSGVAWPAREMPLQYFSDDMAWSYSYGQSLSDVEVTLKCLNTSKAREWNFSASNSDDGYFNVENSNYGKPGCVIFRPSDISIEAGDVYQVTIKQSGTDIANYTVRFFE